MIGLQASTTAFRLSCVASDSARLKSAAEISLTTAVDLVRISLMCCESCKARQTFRSTVMRRDWY